MERRRFGRRHHDFRWKRSEEHTSELQSPCNLACRLLLEKKKLLTQMLPSIASSACTEPAASSDLTSHGSLDVLLSVSFSDEPPRGPTPTSASLATSPTAH